MTGRLSLNFPVAIPSDALLGRGHVGDGVAAVPTPGGPLAAVPVLARGVAATGYRGYTGAESR